jgi:transglutaminase-like putative cysteine protease
MKFRVVSKFDYLVRAPATLLGKTRVHCSPAQKIMRERWTTAPNAPQELIVSEPDRNRFDRLRVAEDGELKLHYRAEVEFHQQFFNPALFRKVSPAHLDPMHIPYLLPSRYCQSDLLGRFAWQKFTKHRDTCDQVLEIMEWIHSNMEYVPGLRRPRPRRVTP